MNLLTQTDIERLKQRSTVPAFAQAVAALRAGARQPIRSIYFRDSDGNLIEVSNEVD